MPTYFGKLCVKHPEAGGKRHGASRSCVVCARLLKYARRKRQRVDAQLVALEERLRVLQNEKRMIEESRAAREAAKAKAAGPIGDLDQHFREMHEDK